ncbi:MAG: hypothetical protein LBV45_01190 [Xanthomonadaceae bacterium]|jgi:hypothetical protein|nr:hypothetical protein [Xanthomonadaceae bacterium]
MFRISAASLAVILSLAACSGPKIVRVEPIDGVISGRCHVDMVKGVAGLSASASTIDRARVDSDSTDVRVIDNRRKDQDRMPADTPGGHRLTIETGANNAITAVYCG